MDMNGRGLPSLPERLDLNLPADQLRLNLGSRPLNLARAGNDQDSVILVNRRLPLPSMQENQQSHLIHVLQDPAAMSGIQRPGVAHSGALDAHSSLSNPARVSTSAPIQTNPNTLTWHHLQTQNPVRERNFMFLGGTSATSNAPIDQTVLYQFASVDSNHYQYQDQMAMSSVNFGIGYSNTYHTSVDQYVQSNDSAQTYSDGLQTRMNYRTNSSAGTMVDTQHRPSMLRRTRTGPDDIGVTRRNAPNVFIEHRSTTIIRRRRALQVRNILHLYAAGQAYGDGANEDFITLQDYVSTMLPYGDAMIAEQEIENGGLSEEEITMNVRRLIQCRACFEIEHAGEVCCICQEDYNHGENICKLRCNHIYHFECIKEWLVRKNFCPICKAPAMNRDGAGPSNQTHHHAQPF